MLQELNGVIQETTRTSTGATLNAVNTIDNCYQPSWPYTAQWHAYPVYITQDKTAKAVAVLKALEAETLLKCDSVPKFIALVEKIAGLL